MVTTTASPRVDSWNRWLPGIRAAAAVRMALRAGGLLLVGFHVALLLADLAGGRLFDPIVAGKWAAAAVLCCALAAFWRVGVPLLWGRKAAALWLLVLVLHVGVQTPVDENETAS